MQGNSVRQLSLNVSDLVAVVVMVEVVLTVLAIFQWVGGREVGLLCASERVKRGDKASLASACHLLGCTC